MIKRLVKQMLTAQVLSALTVSVCLLVDSIMISRFYGDPGMAAYGLANPILLVIGAIGSMLSAGVQVVCSRSLGKGEHEETNVGYASSIAVVAAVSAVFVPLVLLLRTPLATLMGAGGSASLLSDTRDYITGFVIGAPATMAALILVPFLQIAGQSGLLIASVLAMTLTDVGFDLLNVFVFHGGMFGMGLASSLSYYAAMLIGGAYFLSKKCVFEFSLSRIRFSKIRELFVGGLPTVFNMASSVVLVFVMNQLMMKLGGANAVAAIAVVVSIGNASNCISTGMGGVSLTMTGILYNEEDHSGLRELLRLLLRYAAYIGVAAAGLLLVFAPACVGLFIANAGESRDMAIVGLRLYAFGLIPCCVNNALKCCYQGTDRVRAMELICILENAVLPSLSALVLSVAAGMRGVWFYYVCGELLTLFGIVGYTWLKRPNEASAIDRLLMLKGDFGVPKADLMEANIHDLKEVMVVSRAAERFC